MKAVKFIVLLFSAMLLSGCFGSGKDQSDDPVGGFYSTHSFFISESGDIPRFNPVVAIIAATGEARFMFIDSIEAERVLLSPQFVGFVTAAGNAVSATLTAYVAGGVQTDSVQLRGTIDENGDIFGTYRWGDDFGSFGLYYNLAYEALSSLNLISGIWTRSDYYLGGLQFAFTLAIDAEGAIDGSDTDGCIYNGHVAIIDARYNVYRLSLEVSSCGVRDGDYRGLASIHESDELFGTPVKSLYFSASSVEHAITTLPLWLSGDS